MEILNNHPKSYEETKLYKRLRKLGEEKIIDKVDSFIGVVEDRLNLTGRAAFGDYTLHNAQHSLNLMGIAEGIISKKTMDRLSSAEIMMMIMSFYFHDIGMASSHQDAENIRKSEDFKIFLKSHTEYSDKIDALNKKNDTSVVDPNVSMIIEDVYHTALTDYLRPKHATKARYKTIINELKKNNPDLFLIENYSFEDKLCEICESHNEDTTVLSDSTGGIKRFDTDYYLLGEPINLQFCAAVLRLTDILDFDYERAPKSLYNALGLELRQMPGFKVSIREWQKQISVHTIRKDQNALILDCQCTSPSIDHALRKMCISIENEIRKTQKILNENNSEISESYKIDLPQTVSPKIQALDYVYKDYSIHLNEHSIIQLLMGENLYPNPYMAARELVQNSIDACRVLHTLYGVKDLEVGVDVIDKDGDKWLVVTDNGIGMDDNVISNYLFNVGNSYYNSTDFRAVAIQKNIENFEPISRFGIGFLSVFMIGDIVKIKTQNSYSKSGDIKCRLITIDGSESLAIIKESDERAQGTIIEVHLRPEYSDENHITGLLGYIRNVFVRPEIPIRIKGGNPYLIKEREFLKLQEGVKERLEKDDIVSVCVDFKRYSKNIEGYAYFFFYMDEDCKLHYEDKRNKYIWKEDNLKFEKLFVNRENINQATVNGIRMIVKKIGSLFNYKKKIISFVMDINVIGRRELSYNVSRQNLIGKGLDIVREDIINCVEETFKEQGIWNMLTEETKQRFVKSAYRYKKREKLDELLLMDIKNKYPTINTPITARILKEVADAIEMDIETIKPYVYAIANSNK